MPIHFARFWTADYRHQYCVRCIGEAPEAAINANRYIHYVAFVEIDRALLVALQPEYLPAPLHWDEHLLGRVSMQRRAFARLGAYIGDRETHRALLDVRLQGRILGDAHTHHVDNLALIARNALVKECHVQRLGLSFTRDALALHRLFRDARNGFTSNTWIDNRHGLLLGIGEQPAKPNADIMPAKPTLHRMRLAAAMLFAAVHESAFGTKRTCQSPSAME